MFRFLAVFTLVTCLAGAFTAPLFAAETNSASASLAFKKDALSIKSADGKTHSFSIELAETKEQQAEGLKHRKELAENYGMLFVFEEDTYVEMWMKDTFISLDILFLDSHGKVIYIAAKTKPDSTEIISAKRDARGVFEIAAGLAEKKGIKVGDQVVYPYFKP